MLISAIREVPEVLTGLIGLLFIVSAFISSIMHNKKLERCIAEDNTENLPQA